MGARASQIASLTVVYSTVYTGADQRKHQSPASLAFVRGIHRWRMNSPYKWSATRKMFPFDDVIMLVNYISLSPYGSDDVINIGKSVFPMLLKSSGLPLRFSGPRRRVFLSVHTLSKTTKCPCFDNRKSFSPNKNCEKNNFNETGPSQIYSLRCLANMYPHNIKCMIRDTLLCVSEYISLENGKYSVGKW